MVAPFLLFLVAFAVRVAVAVLFMDPAYPDALYYTNLAHELASGGGFSVDYIWNFVEVGGTLPAIGALPIPSNAHWMPLAALVQVPFVLLLGPTPVASGLPFWLIAAAVAPLTWFIGRDAGLRPWQAVAAGLLVIVPAGVTPFLGQPDNFALFMLLGALSIWLCARGLHGHRWSFAAGGLVVGLAFLSRNDGVLLGLPFALAFLYDLLRRPRLSRIGWWPAVLCAAGFIFVVAPWLLRQLDVFAPSRPRRSGDASSSSPSTGSSTASARRRRSTRSCARAWVPSREPLGGLWDAFRFRGLAHDGAIDAAAGHRHLGSPT